MIEAKAFYSPGKGSYLGGVAYLWALVYPDHATISNRPTQPTGIPRGTPIPPPTEKPRGPKPGEGNITPGPAPIPPVLYPIETPSEKPSGGANITPTSLSPPSSSSLPSGGTTFTNPLVVTGGFTCNISENSLPQSPQQRDDELKPIVWGGVYIYHARTGAYLGGNVTSDGSIYSMGSFNVTIENPYPDGFDVALIPNTTVAAVVDPRKTLYSDLYYYKGFTSNYYPGQSQQSYYIDWWRTDASGDYVAAWRIYGTIAGAY